MNLLSLSQSLRFQTFLQAQSQMVWGQLEQRKSRDGLSSSGVRYNLWKSKFLHLNKGPGLIFIQLHLSLAAAQVLDLGRHVSTEFPD
ncbi:hypothetical protein L3X38_030307 [Prunus dulcis]|uniref:Uncharacterized protein n=1 Tax=Prunus dulcis TaxID=3755 RepID=A0AAD4VB83_PRUDU|nr:hypothetical protein L3X38_030307 [Prunus dulcis]